MLLQDSLQWFVFIAIAVFLTIGLIFRFNKPKPLSNTEFSQPEPKEQSINFADNYMELGGKRLVFPLVLADLVQILGKPEKDIDGSSTSYLFYSAGLSFSVEPPNRETITKCSLYRGWAAEEGKWSPCTANISFAGKPINSLFTDGRTEKVGRFSAFCFGDEDIFDKKGNLDTRMDVSYGTQLS
jgi:hypothetical protein